MTTANSLRLFISESTSPTLNLAYENYLFKSQPLPTLFIYRNDPCVVIGRNQNPWLEANLEYLNHNNIPLIRRYSGGGTVYHDLGNTNYSMITTRDDFSRTRTAEQIVTALKSAFHVKLNDRHDIMIQRHGKWLKCSGSAFKISKDRAYAHGTMLLSSDLAALRSALRPMSTGIIDANGVTSVPSSVGILNTTHDEFCETLARQFDVSPTRLSPADMTNTETTRYVEELESSAWKFTQTPKFKQRVNFNGHIITATIVNGQFRAFEIDGPIQTRESEVTQIIETLRDALLKLPFSSSAITTLLSSTN